MYNVMLASLLFQIKHSYILWHELSECPPAIRKRTKDMWSSSHIHAQEDCHGLTDWSGGPHLKIQLKEELFLKKSLHDYRKADAEGDAEHFLQGKAYSGNMKLKIKSGV